MVNRIEMNRSEGVREVYEQVTVHRTEIANYEKRDGKCTTFQSAWGHLHYKEKDGKTIWGDAERLTQTKYNVEVLYIQDEKLTKNGKRSRDDVPALRRTGLEPRSHVL